MPRPRRLPEFRRDPLSIRLANKFSSAELERDHLHRSFRSVVRLARRDRRARSTSEEYLSVRPHTLPLSKTAGTRAVTCSHAAKKTSEFLRTHLCTTSVFHFGLNARLLQSDTISQ